MPEVCHSLCFVRCPDVADNQQYQIQLTLQMKKIIWAACAAAVLAGCARVSDVTKISGKIDAEGISEVNVIVPELQIDTLVPVSDGKFSLEIPSDAAVLGSIQAANYGVEFIPDGTRLSVSLSYEPTVTSRLGAGQSVQERYNEFKTRSLALRNDMQAIMEQVSADQTLSDEEKIAKLQESSDSILGEFMEYNRTMLESNKDNVLALFAVQNLAMDMEDPALDSLLSTLSDRLQKNEFVQELRRSISIRENTAEGKMFTDFSVEQPGGKTASLSDYVGKGRYVLVDFWASWCGPCKAEIPNIKAVWNKYRSKGLDVLSVAVWDNPQATKDTARVYGVNWKQIVNAQSVPTDLYGIEGIPHVILFGPDGTILKRNLRGEQIAEEVAKYLD